MRNIFSILFLCYLTASGLQAQVVINELHYNPDGSADDTEFIELWNTGEATVDISGWTMSDGVDFTFPGGTILPAGGFAVIARYPAIFSSIYPWVGTVYGPFLNDTKLKNSGERVAISNSSNVVSEITYNDESPWPTEPDGDGVSLELLHPLLDLNNALS